MSPRGTDTTIARLASAQDGIVARRQLLALDVPESAIDRRLRGDRLHRLHPGVYAVGHTAVSERGRAIAALIATGEGSVLGHQSAAWADGLMPAPTVHHVVTTKRWALALEGVRVHQVRSLRRSQVTRRDGLPATTTARTLLDLAATVDAATLQRALNEADYRRKVTTGQLEALLTQTRGHRGAARLRAAMLDQAPAKSPLEDRFFAVLRAAELPLPAVNERLLGVEADFVWADRMLIVETDGWAAHGTLRRKRSDARRDARLAAAGWTVLRVARADLVRRPYAVIARIAPALA